MWLLIHAGIEVHHVSQTGPRPQYIRMIDSFGNGSCVNMPIYVTIFIDASPFLGVWGVCGWVWNHTQITHYN